jgi:hypothetical protein
VPPPPRRRAQQLLSTSRWSRSYWVTWSCPIPTSWQVSGGGPPLHFNELGDNVWPRPAGSYHSASVTSRIFHRRRVCVAKA